VLLLHCPDHACPTHVVSLLQRRPPGSTVFPYTTLFRSTGMRTSFHEGIEQFLDTVRSATTAPIAVGFGISNGEQVERFAPHCDRSEEHTSELQSRENLVCRLLLEKKKKIKKHQPRWSHA